MKVAIYYRFSSDKAAQVENSEARQKSELIAEALRLGWDIVWSDGDAETSGDAYKPKLEELKTKVRAGELQVDVLYVSSWDRLTRKDSIEYTEDVAWIREAGIKIAIKEKGSELIDLRDNQRLMLLQFEVFQANQYLKDLAKKVNSGQKARFLRGDLGYANAPFGFKKQGKGIVADEDFPLVARVFETFLESGVSACLPVLERSVRFKDRERISAGTVKTILRNTIYIGIRTFGVAGVGKHDQQRGERTTSTRNVNRLHDAPLWIEVKDTIPMAVDEVVFFKAQKKLDENKRERPKRPAAKYRYSGMLRCAHCGASMVAEKKVKHINYVCPRSKSKHQRCEPLGRKTIAEPEMDAMIAEVEDKSWLKVEFHTANLLSMADLIRSVNLTLTDKSTVAAEKLVGMKAKLAQLVNSLVDDTSRGELDETLLAVLQQKKEEIRQAEEELTEKNSSGSELIDLLNRIEMPCVGVDQQDDLAFYIKSLFLHAKEFVASGGDDKSVILDFLCDVMPLAKENPSLFRDRFRRIECRFKHDGKRQRVHSLEAVITDFPGEQRLPTPDRGTSSSMSTRVRSRGTD